MEQDTHQKKKKYIYTVVVQRLIYEFMTIRCYFGKIENKTMHNKKKKKENTS